LESKLYVSSNGPKGEKDLYLDYYDMELNRLDISLAHHKHSEKQICRLENFDEMKKIAESLSKDFPFVRVDLYNVNGKTYFSELTFIPTGGYMKIEPSHYLEDWGKMLDIT